MSSFDQSRSSYSIPSGFATHTPWNASDGWTSSPPAPPPHAPQPSPGFNLPSQPLGAGSSRLDYSFIDSPDTAPAGVRSNGIGGAGAAHQGLGADEDADEAWQLPRQNRVSVVMNAALEGFVLWQHNVWTILLTDKGTSVERRYSDFVWLLDSLTRRYPFRLLPALPPKRLHVSGHYVATDELFLERRRRGLERALTALVHHPVIRHDGLLNVFLHEQGDLALWRKHNPITLSEESTTRILTSLEESSLPADLDARLSSLRSRIPALVEAWTRITSTADRLAHRRLNQGAEYGKLREALAGALEVERDGWRMKEVEQVEREVEATAKVVSQVGETEQASARRALDTVVEELKRHREIYTSLRDLFARQAALGIDNVDVLKKRVDRGLSKLQALQAAPQRPANFAQQVESTANAVEADQKEIERLLRRRTFVRWCVWEEVRWAMRSTSLLSLTLKDYASSETTFSRQLVEQWSALGDALGVA
ncbi:hypothetical protein JCM8097_002625 [Rhodosporidiobolus ruineniae]